MDGHEYADFCLGDTGAMAGHGPGATVRAVKAQLRRDITHMLPTEDAIVAADDLRRRFGIRFWQFTLSATDANRFAIRLARHVTGRPRILVHHRCHHGVGGRDVRGAQRQRGRCRAPRRPCSSPR